MSSISHDDVETTTDRIHENSWSMNLEKPEHGEDRDRLISDAIDAVARMASGYHVNLVTHGDHGHPEEYLFDELRREFGDSVSWEYVEQCGCGGHVTRVHV